MIKLESDVLVIGSGGAGMVILPFQYAGFRANKKSTEPEAAIKAKIVKPVL
jgi:hypothetical protein